MEIAWGRVLKHLWGCRHTSQQRKYVNMEHGKDAWDPGSSGKSPGLGASTQRPQGEPECLSPRKDRAEPGWRGWGRSCGLEWAAPPLSSTIKGCLLAGGVGAAGHRVCSGQSLICLSRRCRDRQGAMAGGGLRLFPILPGKGKTRPSVSFLSLSPTHPC